MTVAPSPTPSPSAAASAALAAREPPGTYWLTPPPILLDTHALLWWLLDDPQLTAAARDAIADGRRRVCVSAASAWEIAIKYQIGKLPEAKDLVDNLDAYLRKERFEVLPIQLAHALAAGTLPGPHRDPLGPTRRMLIAQAQHEAMLVVSSDAVFREYGVGVLW